MANQASYVGPVFADNTTEYALQQRQLAERKRLAQELVSQGMTDSIGSGYHGGKVFIVGNPWGNVAKSIGGSLMGALADRDERNLQVSQNAAQQEFNEAYRNAPDDATRQNLLIGAQGKGLRTDLHQAFLKAEQDRQFRQQEAEANRLEKSEQEAANRVARAEEGAANRQNRLDARAMPTQHISITSGGGQPKAPSGYRWTDDGNLAPITGGPADKQPGTKPLTQKQLDTQRGFMDMASSLDTYEQMLDRYDPQGKTAASPTERAALESAFTDVQMKLKTLYELGAPQAGDMRLLEQSFSNPTSLQGTIKGAAFGKDPFKAKVQQARQLLKNSQANFEKQMGKATPEAAKPPSPATVVRTGKDANGRKVEQMSDGSIRYAQ